MKVYHFKIYTLFRSEETPTSIGVDCTFGLTRCSDGSPFTAYLRIKKAALNTINRIVTIKKSGCNVKNHNTRPESKKQYDVKNKDLAVTYYLWRGQGAFC